MKSTRVEKAPRFEPSEGINLSIVGDGEKMTLLRVYIKPDAPERVIPEHSHPNEQIGICIEGKGVLKSGGETLKVEPGVSWTIPSGETHSLEAKGDQPVLIYEAFSPPREDYRSRVKMV